MFEGGQNGVPDSWILCLQPVDQLLDPLTLEVRLRAAEVTGNDGIAPERGKAGDIDLTTIGQRPDNGVASIVTSQNGRHGSQHTPIEQVQKQRLQNIIGVVTQGNLIALHLDGGIVKDASTQPRTERAGGPALRNMRLNDGKGVLGQNAVLLSQASQIPGQHLGGEPRLPLVQIDGHH